MGIEQFGAAWGELVAELDWPRLGGAYCEGDGSTFFDAERVEAVLETGLVLVDDLVPSLPRGGSGRSLYFGAAVAELPLILAESLALGREVLWLNLAGDETDELTRSLRAVGTKLGLDLPLPSTHTLASIADESCDHLWMTSVLTDPDAFPALHDALYERVGTELATGRGDLAAERARADALVRELLSKVAPPAIFTTTDEELEVVRPLLADARLDIRVPRSETYSALVGDLVRFTRLARLG
jgi:hypothetical protein